MERMPQRATVGMSGDATVRGNGAGGTQKGPEHRGRLWGGGEGIVGEQCQVQAAQGDA